MNTDESLPESDERFQRLLVQCLEKMQRGEALDRERLQREHPEYAKSLIEFLNNEQMLLGAVGDLPVAEAPKVDSQFEPTLDSGATSTPDSLPVGAHLKYIGEYEFIPINRSWQSRRG